ncbi:hypothetical protein M2132_000072 [Dysgonomonas sp. PH5-45]|uniref:hypothetical protein n=1 Tax=unclassified Dysgonomonas TaxID=2630389 RepID=UPI002476FCDE|nr:MULTISPECIES: hypothetical protein [unclassified Dysgonomonas]MDH6353755.1 hypothetical protein [Dysgonomonas sp. PH5-45]MDH6386658.1 hypothetical protein [Dysgonomonas sp. PH5-37]
MIYFSFKKLLFITICLFTGSTLSAQEKPNYITSGYYQFIYQADSALWEANEDLAFSKYQEAENVMPLLHQSHYFEMNKYVDLLVKRGYYDKALFYVNKMIDEYGDIPEFLLSGDSLVQNFIHKSNIDVSEAALYARYQAFYTPERMALVNEINEMYYNDQRIRKTENEWEKETSGEFMDRIQEMSRIDEYNAKRILEIIEEYGFPDAKLLGIWNLRETVHNAEIIFHHISKKVDIDSLLLAAVEEGKLSPQRLGVIRDYNTYIVDSALTKRYSIYATYEGTKDEDIVDIENLDKRRLAIGMPTRAMENKVKVLMKNK